MSLYNAIKNFSSQFLFEPEVENVDRLPKKEQIIIAGMGGSHLAADLLRVWKPELPLVIHRNYGLPELPKNILRESILIASSYSGNTEEVLDAYEEAGKKGMARAAFSIGGALLKHAQKDSVPYIRMPDTGIQPRLALGFSFKSILAFLGEKEALEQVTRLSETLPQEECERRGRELAERLKEFVPVIYASERNMPVAYNWKIKFNETTKIPAFYNVFPELNHNEMTGFDAKESTKNLSERFFFLFLKDSADHPMVQKRMEITKRLLQNRGLPVEEVVLTGENLFHKVFSSLLAADWASYYLGKGYGAAEDVPMVEEFKVLVAKVR